MSSPISQPKETMTFPAAIQAVIDGKKITKLEWDNIEYYGTLSEGLLVIHKPDGKLYRWTINDGDLLGEDWIVIS